MKKTLIVALFLTSIWFAPHAFAQNSQGFTAIAPIPGLTDQSIGSVSNSSSLANFFNNLYKYLIGIAAVLAVIEIIWGGLEISTQDSVSKHSSGRERIQQAIFGLVLILSPVLVFSIINPSILNLSLNLPTLNTAPGNFGPGGSSSSGNSNNGFQNATSSPDKNGCTSNNGNYLIAVVCPNSYAEENYDCSSKGMIQNLVGCSTDSSGKCVDTAKLYCEKETTVGWYQYSAGFFSQSYGDQVIPADADTVNKFNTGCAADHGSVDVQQNTYGFCPATPNGIPPAKAGESIKCYTKTMVCKPS